MPYNKPLYTIIINYPHPVVGIFRRLTHAHARARGEIVPQVPLLDGPVIIVVIVVVVEDVDSEHYELYESVFRGTLRLRHSSILVKQFVLICTTTET